MADTCLAAVVQYPWLHLANSTTEDIEMRLCLNSNSRDADIALEQLELYVQ